MTPSRTPDLPASMSLILPAWLRLTTALCAIALLAVPARGQDRVGTTAAPFLTLGTGARGQSLGHAYTASATGADALFWNPAGAARRDNGTLGSVFLTQHEWVADIQYNAAGATLPIGIGVLGVSLAAVDYGREEVRTEFQPEGTGDTFGASDFSFGVSYARPLTESFYFGGTVKVIRQAIWDMSAVGVAADFGISLDTGFNGLTLAASIQNFGSRMEMGGINATRFVDVDPNNSGNNENVTAELDMNRWDLPLSFRFGASAPVIRAAGAELRLLVDAQQTNDNVLNADIGGLLSYDAGPVGVEFRAGYRDAGIENVDNHFSFGGGVSAEVSGYTFGADLAYLPFDFLGSATLIDLRVGF